MSYVLVSRKNFSALMKYWPVQPIFLVRILVCNEYNLIFLFGSMELYYLYIVIYILLTKLYYVLYLTIQFLWHDKCNKCTVPSLQSVAIRVSPLAIFMNIWAHFCETSTSAGRAAQFKKPWTSATKKKTNQNSWEFEKKDDLYVNHANHSHKFYFFIILCIKSIAT